MIFYIFLFTNTTAYDKIDVWVPDSGEDFLSEAEAFFQKCFCLTLPFIRHALFDLIRLFNVLRAQRTPVIRGGFSILLFEKL